MNLLFVRELLTAHAVCRHRVFLDEGGGVRKYEYNYIRSIEQLVGFDIRFRYNYEKQRGNFVRAAMEDTRKLCVGPLLVSPVVPPHSLICR